MEVKFYFVYKPNCFYKEIHKITEQQFKKLVERGLRTYCEYDKENELIRAYVVSNVYLTH